MADPTIYLETPPARSPRRGGIRSVAEFRDEYRIALGGVFEWTSPGCQVAVAEAALCYPTTVQDEKVYEGVSTLAGIGPSFGAYVGVECFLDGIDYEATARRLLEQSEDRAMEAALDTYLMTVTDAAATSLMEAVALAEQAADDDYPARPILVMNRGDAVRATSEFALQYDRDGNLWTPNGTPVLASARITEGSVSAIGALVVLTSPIQTFRQIVQPFNNTEFALAERAYGLGIDCEYAVRFEVTA